MSTKEAYKQLKQDFINSLIANEWDTSELDKEIMKALKIKQSDYE